MILYKPYPILFQFGFLKIYSYGFLLVLAFLIATFLAAREAEKKGMDSAKIYNLVLYALVGALIGSRLFYVFENIEHYSENLYTIFNFWEGGLVFYGGSLGAFLFSLLYIKKSKISFWRYANLIAPYIALGIAIARIGCFLNGCCYGLATKLPWAVNYLGILRHPTQIYLALNGLIIFFILSRIRRNKFLFLLILYPIGRFIIDFFRYYETRFYGFSIAQIISIGLLIFALILLFRKEKYLS